jgi:hypothetical protein
MFGETRNVDQCRAGIGLEGKRYETGEWCTLDGDGEGADPGLCQ